MQSAQCNSRHVSIYKYFTEVWEIEILNVYETETAFAYCILPTGFGGGGYFAGYCI